MELALIKISPAKSSKGFTLIEILLVLALVGGMSVLMLPRFSTIDRVKASIRKLNVVVKQTQNKARLSSSLYRLTFELTPPNSSQEKDFAQSFYVEISQRKSVKPILGEEAKSKDKEDEDIPEDFVPDTSILKKKEVLPRGFYFKNIEYSKETIESGKAYIYFFPQGYITQAAIHITNNEKINYTLFIHPLTGQVTIINEEKTLKDFQQ